MPCERPSQTLVARKSRTRRRLRGVVPRVQQRLRHVEADHLHVLHRRRVQLRAEEPGQMAWAHPDERRQRLHRGRPSGPSAPRPARAAARVSAGRPWSDAENCDWPPARCMYTTSERATPRVRSGPWSSSTRASARSMPAVTPADVYVPPSLTKIASGSTRAAGGVGPAARCAASVVTRRPSRRPAAPSTNAPVQIDATCPARAASPAAAELSPGSTGPAWATRHRRPPGRCRRRVSSASASAETGTPIDDRAGFPPTETMLSR